MARRPTAPVKVRCIDCRLERPVTDKYPAYDGSPVFATCEHLKFYSCGAGNSPAPITNPKKKRQQMGNKITK
jgi:hypothetical protein